MAKLLNFLASQGTPNPQQSSDESLTKPQPTPPKVTAKITKGSPIKASSTESLRYIELAPFDSITLDLPADCTWSPGPSSVKIIAPESYLKSFHLAIAGSHLTLYSSATLIGPRPRFEFRGDFLKEVHLSDSAQLQADDLSAEQLISTASSSSIFRVSGLVDEAHFEVLEQGIIDAASLSASIAAAELSGQGMIFLKVTEAIEADLRDNSQLLTIGSPRILDTRRHITEKSG